MATKVGARKRTRGEIETLPSGSLRVSRSGVEALPGKGIPANQGHIGLSAGQAPIPAGVELVIFGLHPAMPHDRMSWCDSWCEIEFNRVARVRLCMGIRKQSRS